MFAGPTRPVSRHLLFESVLVQIRDNRCGRLDPALSPETEPLPYHELCLPRSGLWVRHRRGEALAVEPSAIHCFNRGDVHRVSHPEGCGDRNTGIAVRDDALREALADHDPGAAQREDPFARPRVAVDSAMHLLRFGLLRAIDESGEPLQVEEIALRLVARAAHRASVDEGRARCPAAPRRHRDLAEAARIWLAAHSSERATLLDVALAVGASPFHLCRVFRAVTGESLHRHLLELRVHAALERMTEKPHDDLADVAAATGFSDRTHLSREIRRRFGMPPSRLRELGARELLSTNRHARMAASHYRRAAAHGSHSRPPP